MFKRLNIVVCILAFLPFAPAVSAQTGKQVVKWNPGHYVAFHSKDYMDADLSTGLSGAALKDPNIKGVTVTFKWKLIEPTKGRYDFSEADRWAQVAQSYGKHFIFRFVDRTFGGVIEDSLRHGYFPDYLLDNPRCLAQKYRESWGGNYGAQLALWEPVCMDYFTAITKMFLERYNSNPYFEGMFNEETSLALGQSTDPLVEELTADMLIEQYFRFFNAIKNSGVNSLYIFNMNYWRDKDPYFPKDQTSALANFVDAKFPSTSVTDLLDLKRGGITFPDMWADRNGSNGHEVMIRFRGEGSNGAPQLALAPQMQRHDCISCEEGTEQARYDWARNVLGASHIIWMSRLDDWSTMARRNPDINNVPCPTSFDACISGGAELSADEPSLPPAAPTEFEVN